MRYIMHYSCLFNWWHFCQKYWLYFYSSYLKTHTCLYSVEPLWKKTQNYSGLLSRVLAASVCVSLFLVLHTYFDDALYQTEPYFHARHPLDLWDKSLWYLYVLLWLFVWLFVWLTVFFVLFCFVLPSFACCSEYFKHNVCPKSCRKLYKLYNEC